MDKSFDEIIEGIFLKLNGDSDHDIKVLMESTEQYKDHEYGKEIVRAIGRKLFDVLPEESRKDVEKLIGNHKDAASNVLDEAFLALQKGDVPKALSVIGPYAAKLDEMHQDGLCREDSVSVFYDFENAEQFLFYVTKEGVEKDVRPASEPFARAFWLYACILYEAGRHEEAIGWLRKALVWNPMNAQCYFEIVDNYKRLGMLEEAAETGSQAFGYIVDPLALARWYRDQGFIAIEEGRFELAAAEFVYSMLYERSAQAMSELMYIKQRYGEDYTGMDPDRAVEVLRDSGVPLSLPPDTFSILMGIYDFFVERGDFASAATVAFDLLRLTGDDDWEEKYKGALEKLDA